MWLWRKLKKNWFKIDGPIWNIINYITFKMNDCDCGKGLCSRGKVCLYNPDNGKGKFGNYLTINSAAKFNPIGSGHRLWIQIGKDAELDIGNHVGISNAAITCQLNIKIEDYVLIGSGVRIYDTDFHSMLPEDNWDANKAKRAAVYIEEGVFIGADSTILKGTHIGKHSIIGAGSVVSGTVPAGEIWAGNPARFVKETESV